MEGKGTVGSLFVKVNVGGTIFLLSEQIISESKYFQGMLRCAGDGMNTGQEKKLDFSEIVIDRDFLHFSYMLNCLRDPAYIDLEKLSAIRPELVYFHFDRLLDLVDKGRENEEKEEKKLIVTSSNPKSKFHFDENGTLWIHILMTCEGCNQMGIHHDSLKLSTGLTVSVPKGHVTLVDFIYSQFRVERSLLAGVYENLSFTVDRVSKTGNATFSLDEPCFALTLVPCA